MLCYNCTQSLSGTAVRRNTGLNIEADPEIMKEVELEAEQEIKKGLELEADRDLMKGFIQFYII